MTNLPTEEELNKLVSVFTEWGKTYSPEEFLSMDLLSFPTTNVGYFNIIKKLPKLKTVEVDGEVNSCDVVENMEAIEEMINNGVEFLFSKNVFDARFGGVFTFDLEYEIGDCTGQEVYDSRQIFESFNEYINFLKDPVPYIDNDFGSDEGIFQFFNKLEEDIHNECESWDSEDDIDLTILKIRDVTEELVIWSAK